MEAVVERTDVLLVGGGVASVRCARQLRRDGFAGRIMLVGDELTAPYNRPPLSKELLRDDLPDELVLAEPERWFEKRGVEVHTGRRIARLDLERREAVDGDGRRIGFERCLLATGAEPRRLAVPGGDAALLLRTLADARRLRATAVRAGSGAPVVVVGGGFIGLEVASSLAALGLRPTVIELGPALWSGSLGSALSEWAVHELRGAGVAVRLGAAVSKIDDGAAWIGDERIDAAFVVAGIGVRPRQRLAEGAGLEVGDGVETDQAHRTSHPAVWAAGDVARRAGRRIEHWHAAREGGERAARSMLGHDIGPDPAPWLFSEVAGTSIDVVGAATAWDEERWLADGRLLAWLERGRVVQLAAIGSAVPAAAMRRHLVDGVRAEDLVTAVAPR